MMHIPVNKGHFDLDTDERIKSFSKKMTLGWDEQEYKKYRYEWSNLPKQKIIREYPLQVDIELSSQCNLTCPMCYTITDDFKKIVDRKLLDMDLYKKIIDEVAEKVYAIRLSWRGESTIHPDFIEAIKYAKDHGVREVSFLTNSSKLTLDFFKKIAHAGADWISVSIDGVYEMYDSIRRPLKFEDTFQKIKDISYYKIKNNLAKPTIKVQSIWPAIRDNPEKYYNLFRPYTDLISFSPLIDYLGNDVDIIYDDNFSCPQLYERVFVSANGKVMMCNNDEFEKHIIGDVTKESIFDIWHGEKLTKIREFHNKRDGFKQVEMCKKCFYPRKTEVAETAVVKGREIKIMNYINRKQVIGE